MFYGVIYFINFHRSIFLEGRGWAERVNKKKVNITPSNFEKIIIKS